MAEIYCFTKKVGLQMSKKETPRYILKLRDNKENLMRSDIMNSAVRDILNNTGINEVPVDVNRIAMSLGFDIYYGEFTDKSVYGAMWDGKDSAEVAEGIKSNRFILVNQDDTKERQAFTIAHEIGHFVMHCNEGSNFYERYHGGANQNSDDKKIEDEADYFAANLLLPSFLIIGYIMNNSKFGKNQLIDNICNQFNVERETVNRRFDELGIEI